MPIGRRAKAALQPYCAVHHPRVRRDRTGGSIMAHVSPPAVRLVACLVALCGGAIFRLPHPASAATDTAADLNATDDPADLAKFGRLGERIRAAARRDHIPAPVAEALIRIFSDDVDLQRAAHPGDGF